MPHKDARLTCPWPLAAQLRALIYARGYVSIAQFSRAVGIPPETLSLFVSGKRQPATRTLAKILRALRATPEELVRIKPVHRPLPKLKDERGRFTRP